jgi:hypothetical protein
MDAAARYRRDVLEFIIGPPEAVIERDTQDALSALDVQWPCGCRASGRTVFQVFPCAEHSSEFEGTHDGDGSDGRHDGAGRYSEGVDGKRFRLG